ncbi:MAG: geranyl transferase [Methylotenera sp. 24-45-7]|jgi:farnesyl diphosphate synthase|nr:MAG: geranyl transferase [Mehylophilales bacterium 35-46-6]OYZ40629.1 MAG: geranyl transferase [Methylotenera sp. 24-45-7]OZA08834.1 MAG: geranyl transferase [Methylotenera sp. 17-45-7]OZA53273.1 MAG: geranyl transferase [Methylophilales bacterium 39-45-7]HQS37250.1 polyprenyl synthetase family protein [Methylotenera sp.]
MNNALDFSAWAKHQQSRVEEVLDEVLPSENLAPQKLHGAMRYSALGGGKRVRALLCYAAAELCSTDDSVADAAAAAVELIHAYSLVHDDMPCMDNDDLRRGKPSCHKQYDDATALLVGDALQTLAFDILSTPELCSSANQQISMLNLLAKASGSLGMAGGQAIDLDAVGKSLSQQELETMHQLKTGALIQAAAMLGAAGGTLAQISAVQHFAENIGLAFQVVDDILDIEADTATLGKTAGKDADSNKPTYVSILGLDVAKQLANTLYQNALDALLPYDEKATRLRELAGFITQRSF